MWLVVEKTPIYYAEDGNVGLGKLPEEGATLDVNGAMAIGDSVVLETADRKNKATLPGNKDGIIFPNKTKVKGTVYAGQYAPFGDPNLTLQGLMALWQKTKKVPEGWIVNKDLGELTVNKQKLVWIERRMT